MAFSLPRDRHPRQCSHKYVFKSNDSFYQSTGYRGLRCVSIDYYFCEKCLHEKEVKKDQTFNQTEKDNLPDWAKVITRRVEPDASWYRF